MSGWTWEGTDYSYITMTIVTGNETFPEQNITKEDLVVEDELPLDTSRSMLSKVVLAIVFGIIAFVTVVGNIMVMVSFKMDKQLQTISNYFLFSLAIADFIIGAYSIPFFTIQLIEGGMWPLSQELCDIWLSIDYMASNASVMNLLAISVDRYFSVTRPLSYRARRTTKIAALMILSAWGLSTVIWVPTINAWPYIEGKPNLDKGMCFIQFVETNQFMSILCCMVAFYIPVSIMSGLYIRVWWETVKRQRDLVHLQAGKKASSKRSDSSEEVEPVRQVENPDVAWNRLSNGNRDSSYFNGRIRYLLQSCSSTEDPPGFQEEAPSSEGYTTPHSVGTPHQPSRSLSGLDTASLTRPNTSCGTTGNGRSASWRQSFPNQRHSTSDLLEELKGCKVDSVYTILIQFPAISLNDTTEDSASIRMLADSPKPEAYQSQPGLDKPHQLSTPSLPEWEVKEHKQALVAQGKGAARNISPTTRIVSKQYAKSVQQAPNQAASTTHNSLPRKNKIKKASQEKKQERKAAKTLSFILLVFLITWTPYNVLAVMKAILGADHEDFIPSIIWDIAYCLCYINSTINPFCYALCNATFRKTYVRILTCKWGSAKKQPVHKYYYG